MKKLLALALGVALGLAQAPSPEALKGLGPEEALALAKRWREEGQRVVSYLKTCTSRIPRINLHPLPPAAPDPGRGAPAG